MIAPHWQGKAWHMALTETFLPARAHLFRPGRRHGRGIVCKPHWPVTIFQITSRPGCTFAGAQSALP
jgi:hypothetical protein